MKQLSNSSQIFSFTKIISIFFVIFMFSIQLISAQGIPNIPANKRGAPLTDVFSAYYARDVMKQLERDGGTNTKKTDGTFYLFDEWDRKSLVNLSGKDYKLKNVNLNLLTNEVVFKTDEKKYYSFPSQYVKEIVIGEDLFKYHIYKKEVKFFQHLLDGKKITLLKGYKIRITQKSDIGMLNDRIDKVNKVKQYFYLEGNIAKRLKLKNKKVLAILDKKDRKAVEKYMKENKLSVKNELDLVRILHYYDTL